MMNLTTLPKSFWGYALETAARILNMVPTKMVDRTPYEIWHGKSSKFSYLRAWGCEALVKRDTPDKLDSRSIKCIFVGYPKETMGYYFYNPLKNKIIVSRNAEFFENSFMVQEASGSHGLLEMSGRDLNEPPNYKDSLADPESDKWLEAMNTEMQSMKDNQVWYLVDLPSNGRTVRCKWLFKKKTDMDGNVHTFKARLIAKGFTQTYSVDYRETFSPVADIRSIRILLAIVVFFDYEIWQMDVNTAFLNGHLSEDIYMVQPEGFVDPNHPNKVCKHQRSIYGLKQASRSWNKRFDKEIKKIGFTQNPYEPCVYLKASGSNVAFLVLYVDDILLMGNSVAMLQEVKSWLCKCFSMKDLGEARYILGIKIIRDGSKWLIALSHSAYLEKTLKKFRMENSKKGYTPMIERPDYRKCTRPDVAFAQNLCSHFEQNPSEIYWTVVEKQSKYLRIRKINGTLFYGAKQKLSRKNLVMFDSKFLTDKDRYKILIRDMSSYFWLSRGLESFQAKPLSYYSTKLSTLFCKVKNQWKLSNKGKYIEVLRDVMPIE
ncbi:retrotransposon protein, putative, ty1-copia subclass [Tanacetum coccineum]